jgi:HD-like signal output (HDOD) protein
VRTDQPQGGVEDGPGAALARLERAVEEAASRGDLAVPPYPAVVLRVQEVMARKGFGLAEMAAIIAADASLAADVLRCANSVIYRRGAPVMDLSQALGRIGVQQATRLLLASGLARQAQAIGPLALLRRMAWIEGLASAAVCQSLARQRGLRTEEAFTLGLLHDFGKIVAVSGLETLLAAGPPVEGVERQAWASVVERHHQRIGALVAARWRLPPLVGQIIELHHGAKGPCSDPPLLEVVVASDEVVALLLARDRVAEEDLAALPSVHPSERGPLCQVLEQAPDLVAAFETGPGPGEPSRGPPDGATAHGGPSTPRELKEPETTLRGPRRAASLDVAVSLARRPRLFAALAIGPGGLLLEGGEPLPVNRLLEAELFGPKPFKAWLLVTLCRPEGARFQVEARPFALSGPLREAWLQLAAGQPPAAPSSR